jgi:hypothetical protein
MQFRDQGAVVFEDAGAAEFHGGGELAVLDREFALKSPMAVVW